jgi:lipoprotein-anchoring transpeptidase ErfK/SrfK
MGKTMSGVFRVLALVAAMTVAAFGVSSAANAAVDVRVDVSKQRMLVYVEGELAYTWPVSTGRKGFATPHGTYRPKRMTRMHFSRKYNNAPMPYSVFFRGGYAIHGTNATGRLGRRASHGCVRLSKRNARELYHLINDYGGNARITVHA